MPLGDDGRLTLTTHLVDEATTPLQKLKQTVETFNTAYARSAAIAAADTSKSVGGMAAAFASLGKGIAGVGHGIMNTFSAIGSGLMNLGTQAAKAAGVAAAALLTAGISYAHEVIQKGYQRVITLQNAVAQSAVLMGGDVQKAQGFIEKIRDVVTGTPFSLPDFAKAGQQMLMYGIAAEKIPGILTAIGEASAGNGDRAVEMAQRVSLSMAQMAATGKVSLNEINTMAEAGVPAIKILANHFGVTTAEMQHMISYGTVPAMEAIDALTKGIMEGSNGVAGSTASFAGSMDALAKTWAGAVSIFDASKAKLGEAYLAPLQTAMPGILIAMKGINVSLSEFAPMWEKWLASSGTLEFIQLKLEWIRDALHDLAITGGGPLSAIVEKFKEWGPVLAIAGGAMAGIGSGMLGSIPIIGQFLPVFGPVVGAVAALIAASPVLRAAFGEALRVLGEAFKALAPTFNAFLDIVLILIRQIGTVFGPVIVELARIIADGLVVILPYVVEAFQLLAGALQMILPALAPLIPLFLSLVIDILKALAPILPIIIEAISKLAVIFAELLAKALDKLLPPLAELVIQLIQMLAPILPYLIDDFAWLLEVLTPLIDPLAQLAQLMLNLVIAIRPLIDRLVEFFGKNEAGAALIQIVWGALQTFIGGVVEWFKTYVLPTVQTVFDAIGKIMEWLWLSIVQPVFTFIMDIIRVTADVLNWLWRSIFEPIFSVLGAIIMAFWGVASAAFNLFMAAIELVAAIIGWLWRHNVEPAFAAIGAIISVWWNGVVMPIFQNVWNWIHDVVGPVFQWFYDVIIAPVFRAIGDRVTDFRNFIQSMVDKINEAKPVFEVIGGIFRGIAGFIGDVVRNVGNFLNSGFNQIAGFFKNVTDFLNGNAGGGIAKAFGGGFIVRHMATGGVLDGFAPGKDTIPAMLSPGEAVLVPELVRALGASNIMAANFAYSHGRPSTDGSPDRTGGNANALTGGGTQVTVIVSAGAVQISTSGKVDSEEIREALETALADAARRVY